MRKSALICLPLTLVLAYLAPKISKHRLLDQVETSVCAGSPQFRVDLLDWSKDLNRWVVFEQIDVTCIYREGNFYRLDGAVRVTPNVSPEPLDHLIYENFVVPVDEATVLYMK